MVTTSSLALSSPGSVSATASTNITGQWDLMLNRKNSTYQMFENSNIPGKFRSGVSELNVKWDREKANSTKELKGGNPEPHSQWGNSTLEGLLAGRRNDVHDFFAGIEFNWLRNNYSRHLHHKPVGSRAEPHELHLSNVLRIQK